MARRRFTVRDIAEILEHWQEGRSIKAISRGFGASTSRKYSYRVVPLLYRLPREISLQDPAYSLARTC
jgi:hypothetical protein